MTQKRKTFIQRIISVLLVTVLLMVSAGVENVAAFWNQDNPDDGNNQSTAAIQVRLMHCYHKDTHYDSNNHHIYSAEFIAEDEATWWADDEYNGTENGRKKTTEVAKFKIHPQIKVDAYPTTAEQASAGTALPDTNGYVYEYEMSYAESELVDYAVITHPNITHYGGTGSLKAPSGLKETHNRMYWVGDYVESITKLTDNYHKEYQIFVGNVAAQGSDGEINWWDFDGMCHPEIDLSLSHQTWETVENSENPDVRTFIINPDLNKNEENGQKFLYLLEGTYFNKDTGDANHPAMQSSGIPAFYGNHMFAIVGLVFFRTLDFNANGGSFAIGSISNMRVYSGSNKSRGFTWYNDVSKESWINGLNVSRPTDANGTAYIKPATRTGYKFLGWYAPILNDKGNPIEKSDGTFKCSDVPIYDVNGNAVLTYTDSKGKTQASPYFDSNGNWIYKGNVTAYAKWEYVGFYNVKYDKGASNSDVIMPDDTVIEVGHSGVLSSEAFLGSDYLAEFDVYTNNGSSYPDVVQNETGNFLQLTDRNGSPAWEIEGNVYYGGASYSNSTAVDKTVIKATAVYADYSFILPEPLCKGYVIEGWYDSYDKGTGVFGNCVGKPGEEYTIKTSGDSVNIKLYAKWKKEDVVLHFDYNIPDRAKNSSLGYGLTGADEKQRTVQFDTAIGYDAASGKDRELPSPVLTGYTLGNWSTEPDINVPVDESTKYDGSFDTLYARWVPVSYEITYVYGGGSASDNPGSANYYDELTIKSPTRAGSVFKGWSITGMDGNLHVIDGTKTNNTAASDVAEGKTSVKVTGLRADDGKVTFTAKWENKDYQIDYAYRDKTDSSLLEPDSDVGNPGSFDVDTPTFTLKYPEIKGYNFSHWTGTGIPTNTAPGSVTIAEGSTGDREYTGWYEPKGYSIKYELNGGVWGNNASHPDSAKYNISFEVSNPKLAGCEFLGWDITGMCADCKHTVGGGTLSNDNTSVTGAKGTEYKNLRCNNNEKVVFTAIWSKASYNITYDLNGGKWSDGAVHPASVETRASFNVTNPVATQSGYLFAGWVITGMDDGKHYINGVETMDTSVSGAGAGIAEGYNVSYGNLRYSSGTVQFKALWENEHQVVFMANGGVMTGNSVVDKEWALRFIKFGNETFYPKAEYDSYWGNSIPSVSRTGYYFTGYYDRLTGGNAVFDYANKKVTGKTHSGNSMYYWTDDGKWIGPSLILYARFEPKQFEVWFDVNGGYWASDDSEDYRVLDVIYDSTLNNTAYSGADLYRPGYTFAGWNTEDDGSGYTVYDADGYCTDEGGYWSEDYIK